MSDGTFAVPQGELAYAPGSSGWKIGLRDELRWMEVFLRGGNAWDLFGKPPIGSVVSIG